MSTTRRVAAPATRRWLFADQLGPHFLDRNDQQVLLVESRGVFRRRRFHRAKAPRERPCGPAARLTPGYPRPVGPWQAFAVFAAGVGAGAINAVVGSGTLLTFPTLLALGYPPVTANVSNNIGLVSGGVTGTWGYRRELEGQGRRLTRLVPMSFVGSVTGALLLLRLPAAAFAAIVPVLIGISVVLVLAQPRIAAAVQRRRQEAGRRDDGVGVPASVGTLLAGVYGGYFGAAQGVLLIGILGSVLPEPLQRVNATKNLLSLVVNLVAAVTFIVVRPGAIDWVIVALIAVGSLIGGALGARVGRRLSPTVLRGVVALVGVIAIVRLVA